MIRVTTVPSRRPPLPEQKLDRLFEKSLRAAFGARSWLRHSHTDKTHATGKAFNKGEPDYVGFIHGLFVAVENKVHPNYPDRDQISYLSKISRGGGIALLLVHDKRQGDEAGYYIVFVTGEGFEFSWDLKKRTHWMTVPYVKYGEEAILDLTGLHGLVSHQIHNLYKSVTTKETP